jgi:hypothetical protein
MQRINTRMLQSSSGTGHDFSVRFRACSSTLRYTLRNEKLEGGGVSLFEGDRFDPDRIA